MKTLLLDFGNVMAFFDHRKACRQLAALATEPVSEGDVFEGIFHSELHSDFDCGRISSAQFIDRLRTQFRLTSSETAIVTAWCDIFSPNEDVMSVLPRLKRATTRLHLASNTDELHFQWITRQFSEAIALCDGFTLSYAIGFRKPTVAFFEECIDAVGASADDCIFVDDRLDFVDVARDLGMRGVVYRPGMDLLHTLGDEGLPVE